MQNLVIELSSPQVSDQLMKLDSVEIRRAKEYFQRLVQFQNLTVKNEQKTGIGRAQFDSKTIWVPVICDKASFMLCLHEIGHTVQPLLTSDGQARSEYDAEMFALQRARHFGIDNAFLIEYEKHAKLCVAAYMDAGFRLNKAKWSELSPKVQEVATWLGVTQSIWDNVSALPFSCKLETHFELNQYVPFISRLDNDIEQILSNIEYERATLERFHLTFDRITRDLMNVNKANV